MSREAVESLFAMAYGYRPSVVTSAPGRVNLIGEHTDYNGGEVLPIAIAQRTWVAIAPARTAMSRAVSRERGEVGTWDSAYGAATGTWWDYVAGALAEAASLGSRPHGHDVAVVSDVPMGAGLSSSAALQVATVLAALALDAPCRCATSPWRRTVPKPDSWGSPAGSWTSSRARSVAAGMRCTCTATPGCRTPSPSTEGCSSSTP